MSAGWDGCPPDSRLVDAYERMRDRYGCEGAGRAGYEVLRGQGLAAWIQLFSGCVNPVAPDPISLPPPSPRSETASVLHQACRVGGWGVPERLYPELTELLAGLALSRIEEGVCWRP